MKAETITVTILSDSVAFLDGDGLKRLIAVGALNPKTAATAKLGKKPRSESQAFLLSKIPRVRTLERYRQLVGDPLTNGLLHCFKRGAVLTMERNADPRNPAIPFYVVLDTAIGGAASFITKLAQARKIRVEEREEPHTNHG